MKGKIIHDHGDILVEYDKGNTLLFHPSDTLFLSVYPKGTLVQFEIVDIPVTTLNGLKYLIERYAKVIRILPQEENKKEKPLPAHEKKAIEMIELFESKVKATMCVVLILDELEESFQGFATADRVNFWENVLGYIEEKID
jgi:hypothetical protein